ncbi:MAG: hypothetical protein ACFFAS_02680 [Promethearchaeota archaeon]
MSSKTYRGIHRYNCSPPHTQAVNGNIKAYGAWYLFGRFAVWNVL